MQDFVDGRSDSERHQADARFMRSVLAASDDCIKVLTLDGALSFMSEGGQRVMEVSDFNAIKGCPWPDFWQGGGNADARAAIAAAKAGKSYRFQGEANTALGNPKWWDVSVSPIIGADGLPESILSVSRDVTELKLAEERQRLLALELKHRIKNTIAMIQAIANQTLRSGEATPDIKAQLMDRLRMMADAQDLLTQSAWSKADLHALAGNVLRPHGGMERVKHAGPDVELSSKCALAMSLALHELATNATKYGALSNETGQVEVVWTIDDRAQPPRFEFIWRETRGPVVTPPSRTGFGSRMIERALAGYFSGAAEIDYAPSGVVFTLSAPLEALTAE